MARCPQSSRMSGTASPMKGTHKMKHLYFVLVSHHPHRAAHSAASKRWSRQGSAWWNSWKRTTPDCLCWPGLTPSWWKTLCFCLWEQASFCEYTDYICTIIEISFDPLCAVLNWSLMTFQHHHLLPQSGGRWSEDNNQFTTGTDTKCKISHT